MRRLVLFMAVVAFGIGLLGGGVGAAVVQPAMVAAQGPGGVIAACADAETGALRLASPVGPCTNSELPRAWNVMGPPGLPGLSVPVPVLAPVTTGASVQRSRADTGRVLVAVLVR